MLKDSWGSKEKIIHLIAENKKITTSEMSEIIGVTKRSILKITNSLQQENIIQHVGPSNGGHWEIVK